MILYQVISTYQLLNAIVHKEKNHADEKCVLIISNWLTVKHPNYDELNEFFDTVIVMDAIIRMNDNYFDDNTKLCYDLLKKNQCKIEDFSEIHAMGCHYNFGVFLAHNKIPFYFWEDASGITSKPEVLYNIYSKGAPVAAKLCLELGLYDGTTDSVISRVCNYKAQTENFDYEKTTDFDVIAEYMSLDYEKKLKIRSFFTDATEIEMDEDFVLVLTQHFFNLKILSFEDQALIYQLFIDYFFPNDKLLFKTHPDDLMFYGILFPEATVLRKKFPSEFLPSLITTSPKTITTISSTAIDNLKSSYKNNFALDTRFEKDFYSIHKYGVIADLKKNVLGNGKVISVGANDKVVSALISSNDGENCLYIVDDIHFNVENNDEYHSETNKIINQLENATENEVFIFVNSKMDYCFYDIEHKHLWNNLYPISISKEKFKDCDFYADENEEVLYLFTKNMSIVDRMYSYCYERTLKHTGLKISARVTEGDDRKIYLLQALLAATEYSLLKAEEDAPTREHLDENAVYSVKYSNPDIQIEDWDEHQNEMRILEGIINATEARLIFRFQSEICNKKTKGEKKK